MAKLIQASESYNPTTCNTVFIDTSLDTHLALFVSCSDTVSDLKSKILHEHPLCFPKIGGIKIDALKVKRRGFFYHLPDSMLITSVFSGVRKSWFISVGASRVEESDKNGDMVDGVHFESDFRLTSGGDLLVPLDVKKEAVVNQRGSDVNGEKDHSKLEMVEHSGDDIGETKSLDASKRSNFSPEKQFNQCVNKIETGGGKSKPMIWSADMQGRVHGERAREIGSGGKRLHKRKRQSEVGVEDLFLEVADASVPESATSELQKEIIIPEDVLGDAGVVVSLDTETGIQNIAYGQKIVPISYPCKQLDAVKYRINVTTAENGCPGEDVLCENDKFKSKFGNDRYKDLEATLPPKPFARKKLKTGKEKGYKDFMEEDRALLSNFTKGNKKVDCYHNSEKKRKEKKSSNPVNKQASERPSSSGVGMGDMDPSSLECIKDASKLALASFTEGIRSSEDVFSDCQKDALDQMNKVEDERNTPLDVFSNAMPSEICQLSGQDERELKSKKGDIDCTLLEVDENLDCGKSSKKRSKSKRTTVLINQKPVKSGITHAEGSTSDRDAWTASTVATSSSAKENSGPEDAILNYRQKAAADQPSRVDEEGEPSLVSPKTVPSEICEPYAWGETEVKSMGMPLSSKFLEVDEPVNSGKSSMKKRKSRKSRDSMNETPVVSAAEHSKASIPLAEPFKAVNKDHSIGKSNATERNILPEDGREKSEVGIVNSDLLATDKENDHVVQNVLEYVEQIYETQMKIEDVDGKSKIKDKNKRNSGAKNSKELQAKNSNVDLNGTEIAVVPSLLDVGGENSMMMVIEPKDLGVDSDAAHFSAHHVQDAIVSGPCAVPSKEKCSDPVQEIDKSPSSPDIEMGDVDATMVEGLKDGSNQTISSSAKGMRRSKDVTLNGYERAGADQIDGVEDKRETPFDLALKTMPSQMCQPSNHDEGETKTTEVTVSSELIEVGKPADPGKSSKRRKKSRKPAVSESKAPVMPADEHVKTSRSLAEPLKAFDVNPFISKSNKNQSNMLPEDEKAGSEVGTVSSFPLATDKEINDVIENVVESMKLIDKPQLNVEAMSGKLKKKNKKKQNSDEKNSLELQTRIADNDLKANRNKRKHEKHSHAPAPNLQSSQKLNENNEIRAKSQTATAGTAEFQQTASDDKHEKYTLEPNKELSKSTGSGKKAPPNKQKLNSGVEEANRSSTFNTCSSTASINKDKEVQDKSNSVLESSEGTVSQYKKDPVHSSYERSDIVYGRKDSTTHTGGVVDSSKLENRLIGKPSKPFDDDNNGSSANKVQVDDSDASTRTPSDDSVSSDYSDGESSAGSYSSKREQTVGKKIKKLLGNSGMTLDEILKSSSRFKMAKITASQLQMEDDLESQPDVMVPDSQPKL